MENVYTCIRCSFQTNKRSIILKHLEKKYKCKKKINIYFLPNDLLNEISLYSYYINENNENKNDFQCKNCLKIFLSKFNLNRHEKTCISNNKKKNLLIQYKLYTYFEIKKYLTDFYKLTTNKYLNENKLIVSFYKEWNLNHIDLLTKKLLYISNDKYTDLLRKILDNDKNLNVIYDKNENHGYVMNNLNQLELVDKNKIVSQTIQKILFIFELFKNELEENNTIIDKKILFKESIIIDDKYTLYLSNEFVKTKVENIILNIYNERYIEMQLNAYNELNKNIGF